MTIHARHLQIADNEVNVRGPERPQAFLPGARFDDGCAGSAQNRFQQIFENLPVHAGQTGLRHVVEAISKVLQGKIYVARVFGEQLIFKAVQSAKAGTGSPLDLLTERLQKSLYGRLSLRANFLSVLKSTS